MWHVELPDSSSRIAVNVTEFNLGSDCSYDYLAASIYTYTPGTLVNTINSGITFLIRKYKKVCSVALIAVMSPAVMRYESIYFYARSRVPFFFTQNP